MHLENSSSNQTKFHTDSESVFNYNFNKFIFLCRTVMADEGKKCFLAFRNACKKGPLSKSGRERIKSMIVASRVYNDGKEEELQIL